MSDAGGVSSVQIYDGATLLGPATISSGNWSYTTTALPDGSHSFTAKATDGTLNNSTIQTTALSITGTDDAPVLTVAATASYSENAAPVTLSPAATVNDVDNQTLQSATVSISSGLLTGDVLAATTAGTGITASYNAASGVLTLTGNDTLAHYQQVLDSVTYVSTSDNPTNFGTDPSRTISGWSTTARSTARPRPPL